MAQNDNYHDLKVVQACAPQAVSADKTGDAIDLLGFDSVLVELSVGVVTDGVYAFELQESDTTTAGDFTAVADGDLIGTEKTGIATGAGNGGSAIYKLGYIGNKRYIRYKITETSAGSTGMLAAVTAILGNPAHAPVA